MQSNPPLRVTRFAQLSPGDLFILRRRDERYVGLVVHDSTEDGQTLLLPIGPTLPSFMTWPTLTEDHPGATVISFGADYAARLPVDPAGWEDEEPPAAVTALVVAEGATFLRCNFSPRPGQFQACYVNLADGEICTSGGGRGGFYVRPSGIRAYATRWELSTTERPARTILSYPFPVPDE
jgi:hypothetical protein